MGLPARPLDRSIPYPYDVRIIEDPSQHELRAIALRSIPAMQVAACGNLNRVTRNKNRVAQYTYIIAPDADRASWSGQTMPRERAEPLIERQRLHIERQEYLIAVNGMLGVGESACPTQWLYTREAANIAAMQQLLAFPRPLGRPFVPELRVVYTPDCFAEGMPGHQAILVDLEAMTTYILGPDYFGESKKAALRMLNERVYRQGGLVLHAGAKAVTSGGTTRTMLILGLSGTGKTTTTFSRQGEATRPIQDDMVGLWPGARATVTENGCFAKTFGLTEQTEPVLWRASQSSHAWVENAYLDAEGRYDFSKEALTPDEVRRLRDVLIATGASRRNLDAYVRGSIGLSEALDARGVPLEGWDFVFWTQNGRSVIPMAEIPEAADPRDVPPVGSMGILNRDEGPDAATPGIVRFVSPEQAAGYFMLGETSKTSAAGKERGRTRSPFTQPFFPRAAGLQAGRFSELVATMPGVTLWLMNTGMIGGDGRDVKEGRALKVRIADSSAILEALVGGGVVWKRDPDFGYEIVDVEAPANAALVGRVSAELLEPRRFFERMGRADVYRTWVETMKRERRAFLEKFNVPQAILDAVLPRA